MPKEGEVVPMWENLEEGKEAFHRQNNCSERNFKPIRNNVQ